MAKSANEPLVPGPLQLRDTVRSALYALRHLTQVSLDGLSPPRPLPAAELDVSLVTSVEEALQCRLPHEILGCLANGDDELDEYGFLLGKIVDHTRFARKRGCPKDLVAVGRHPDSHAFYCVHKDEPRNEAVRIGDLDNFDGSIRWYDLGEWLAKKVERRLEFLSEDYGALVGWKPSPNELTAFTPSLR